MGFRTVYCYCSITGDCRKYIPQVHDITCNSLGPNLIYVRQPSGLLLFQVLDCHCWVQAINYSNDNLLLMGPVVITVNEISVIYDMSSSCTQDAFNLNRMFFVLRHKELDELSRANIDRDLCRLMASLALQAVDILLKWICTLTKQYCYDVFLIDVGIHFSRACKSQTWYYIDIFKGNLTDICETSPYSNIKIPFLLFH